MSKTSLAKEIEGMTWSFSRVKSFEDCPYKWYLRYIHKLPPKEMFFSSYGSFMHYLLELYNRGEKSPKQLKMIYLTEFKERVIGRAPNKKVFGSYFKTGLDYLSSLEPLPFEVVEIERQVNFSVDGCKMIGYIDVIAEDDGEFIILDHKSRALKERSTRAKPTRSDRELDDYLRQLYLYTVALEELYGKTPKYLCFNCFRTKTLIKEPFVAEQYEVAKSWLKDSVAQIITTEVFKPKIEYFKCRFLCDMQDHCEYYELSKE